MAVLNQIRNALNGVVVVEDTDKDVVEPADRINQFNLNFAANKESDRYETEEPLVTVSSYDPDRW